MLRNAILGIVGTGLLFAPMVHAASQPYVASIYCFPDKDALTYGTMRGYVKFAKKIIYFNQTCVSTNPGVNPLPYPTIDEADGPIESMSIQVVARTLSNPGVTPHRDISNLCVVSSANGFVSTTCMANPNQPDNAPGMVGMQISIGD